MGSGRWFRSIISPRRGKKERSKDVKAGIDTENSNGSDGNAHGDPSTLAIGASQSNHTSPGLSAENFAALRIQRAYRKYMVRKASRRVMSCVRFNVVIQSHDTQKQASSTLKCIHSWSNIQSQIRARRQHMVTEGRIKQKKLENQLKLEVKLHELEVEWCGGSDTMEEILSRIQQREEAAVKRERAMAYAFTHQWRPNPTQYLGQAYYSIGKESWGWSWKERWIAARPWELRAHAQPNKGHSRQGSKSDMKLLPFAKNVNWSNEKSDTKDKSLPSNPNADHQRGPREAFATVGASHTVIPHSERDTS